MTDGDEEGGIWYEHFANFNDRWKNNRIPMYKHVL